MEVAVILLVGVLIGVIATLIITRPRPIGSLRIDESDPDDGPYLFLELSTDPNVIKQDKYVTFKVDARNYISPK